jgi:hypothetical protein
VTFGSIYLKSSIAWKGGLDTSSVERALLGQPRHPVVIDHTLAGSGSPERRTLHVPAKDVPKKFQGGPVDRCLFIRFQIVIGSGFPSQ